MQLSSFCLIYAYDIKKHRTQAGHRTSCYNDIYHNSPSSCCNFMIFLWSKITLMPISTTPIIDTAVSHSGTLTTPPAAFLEVRGYFTSSKNRNDLCFLYSKNQQKNTKKKNKSKSKRYQNTHRFSSSLFSFLYFLMMIYSAAQSKHATIKSRLILPYPKLS